MIPEGTMFDRVGGIDGSYLCPVPSERDVFSVQERAIPYLFLEDRISVEPSYHKYVAICEISKQSLAKKMAENPEIFSDDPKALMYANKISNLEIIEGYIAAVKSFGAQGVGGGYQYKMPLPIRHLLILEVIKEV